MSTEGKEAKELRTQVPETERCLFTSSHGRRCSNPHMGNATGYCILHEGRMRKVDDAEVSAIAEQLLANNVELQTRDDVNRFTSQLLTLVTQKRISRQDGSLLAYIASVLLQTIAPVKPIVEEKPEPVESVAEPIRDPRMEVDRKRAPIIPREQVYREHTMTMPGRTDNPYMYPTKLR